MSWWADLIGRPYADGARGPDAFDCWGLVHFAFSRELGIDLPDHAGVHPKEIREVSTRMAPAANAATWSPVEAPRAFDVALMSHAVHSKLPTHIGIMVSASKVLHIWRATDACVMELGDHRLSRRVLGFFRHREAPCPKF